jgi:hypothetical protein
MSVLEALQYFGTGDGIIKIDDFDVMNFELVAFESWL